MGASTGRSASLGGLGGSTGCCSSTGGEDGNPRTVIFGLGGSAGGGVSGSEMAGGDMAAALLALYGLCVCGGGGGGLRESGWVWVKGEETHKSSCN